MRDFLMYDFNISLKSILMKYNQKEFDKYFYNCCRQTAIMGALVMSMNFDDYDYKAYEAKFTDTLFGKPVSYEHCFIIASHKEINRNILVDMARTTNPLVFEPIYNGHFYPEIEAYKDTKMMSCVEIPYLELLKHPMKEYMTNLTTMEFLIELNDFMDMFKQSDSKKKELLVCTLYELPFKKLEHFKTENNILRGDNDGNGFIETESTTKKCNTGIY